jgi:hypothetical protein
MHEVYAPQFDLPLDRIVVVSYHDLSSAEHADILERIKPDLIVADEAHKLSRLSSARSKRFVRYMQENPGTRFVALTGTATRKSLIEYSHLMELALRKNSPMPLGYRELKDWAGAIDVEPDYRLKPGILEKLCEPGEAVRDGFRRRRNETEGVVATTGESSIGSSLIIRADRSINIPQHVREQMAEVKSTWEIGDEQLESSLALSRILQQLACGFYYKWDWPGGAKDHEWLDARAAWHQDVREVLKRSRKGLDSPLLVARAADAGKLQLDSWADWKRVRGRYKPAPPTVAVWLDDFLVDAAAAWVKRQDEPCIVWYRHVALGERLAKKHNLPLFGAGTDADLFQGQAMVASIAAQGEGKNLQHFSRNLVLCLSSSGKTFEQMTGRTHRPGQLADEVIVDWICHTDALESAMVSVVRDAEYIEQSTGKRQKVLYASRL